MSDDLQPELRNLKARAQHLEPIVRIGKAGLSDALIKSVDQALDAHELLKVRFEEFKKERKALAPLLAERTNSRLVTLVGHVAVLYRPHQDPDPRT